jgi:hypothetical protein
MSRDHVDVMEYVAGSVVPIRIPIPYNPGPMYYIDDGSLVFATARMCIATEKIAPETPFFDTTPVLSVRFIPAPLVLTTGDDEPGDPEWARGLLLPAGHDKVVEIESYRDSRKKGEGLYVWPRLGNTSKLLTCVDPMRTEVYLCYPAGPGQDGRLILARMQEPNSELDCISMVDVEADKEEVVFTGITRLFNSYYSAKYGRLVKWDRDKWGGDRGTDHFIVEIRGTDGKEATIPFGNGDWPLKLFSIYDRFVGIWENGTASLLLLDISTWPTREVFRFSLSELKGNEDAEITGAAMLDETTVLLLKSDGTMFVARASDWRVDVAAFSVEGMAAPIETSTEGQVLYDNTSGNIYIKDRGVFKVGAADLVRQLSV